MANILDYIAWRGDLTFEQSPFNDVDSLIFSVLSYVDFELTGMVIDFGNRVKLKEAGESFAKLHADDKVSAGRIIPDDIYVLFDEMSRAKRYQDLYLSCYVNQINPKEEVQFSAITMELPGEELYIAFRGTDDTIVGWKEDFNMSFRAPVPSQLQAVSYLAKVAADKRGKLRLGGHSKGGNLAAYATAFSDPSVQMRIISTHSFDGPGFTQEIFESEQFRLISRKIQKVVPQSSMIGMLLEHDDNYKIVASKQIGIMQHDPFSWEILGTSFVFVDDISASTYRFDKTFRSFIASMELSEKESFVETLFMLLDETGSKTLSEISLKDITQMIKRVNSEGEEKKVLQQAFKLLLQSVEQQRLAELSKIKLPGITKQS